jgi:hypothetical protein
MFGFRMCHNEDEQLDLWHLFRSAMDHRAPVRVSFFKQKKDDDGRPIHDHYVKVTRVVEPSELTVTKDGRRVVKVVDRSPEGTWGPEYRTIRLDRVAYSRHTRRPLAVRMLTHHYMCPSELDGLKLHPNKTTPKDYPPGDVPPGYAAA